MIPWWECSGLSLSSVEKKTCSVLSLRRSGHPDVTSLSTAAPCGDDPHGGVLERKYSMADPDSASLPCPQRMGTNGLLRNQGVQIGDCRIFVILKKIELLLSLRYKYHVPWQSLSRRWIFCNSSMIQYQSAWYKCMVLEFHSIYFWSTTTDSSISRLSLLQHNQHDIRKYSE